MLSMRAQWWGSYKVEVSQGIMARSLTHGRFQPCSIQGQIEIAKMWVHNLICLLMDSQQYLQPKVFAIRDKPCINAMGIIGNLASMTSMQIWQPCICCLAYLFAHHYSPLCVKRQIQCVKLCNISASPLNRINRSAVPVND